ncbi:glycosyltransferase [Streptomyces sp. NRRL F-5123]|uniref:glycosyltransferase n=1 Tax=Streptomyces sp. NRRL F-5123 TaxID=1463856 RepID=UPI00099B41A9|nr:bifunctional polysaccharide deacetylase/glycosyltransferase family 2 protein [Streptomyces sp. NRRL F-5123]
MSRRRAAPAGRGGHHGRRGVVRSKPLRTHWLLLTVLVLTLSGTLLIQGYTQHMFGIGDDAAGSGGGPANRVPTAVAHGGPVIDSAATPARTARPRARTIALTFDDGPDPRWTPQILAVLRRHHVHATFFVVGTEVAAHPALVRQIAADGNQIGIHTFTHANLGAIPAWQRSLELREAQLALAGATGQTSYLLRPPYSSSNEALNDHDWESVETAGEHGYLTVLSTQDSEDWQRPGADAIVANATPHGSAGQILLMHDGGGDRSQTVAALDRLLPQLTARGYRFATVSEAVGLPQATRPASTGDHWLGLALIGTLAASGWALRILGWLLLAAGVLAVLRAAAVVIAARRHTGRRGKAWGPPVTEPVTVIVPAYNESAGIEAAVRSLLASDHPVEVVVVDDGSTDGTADLVESLHLPYVRVIRQANAGKPAALNAGIAAASFELLVMVDGDTVFEPDAVRTLIQPFADPRVGAVSGNAKVVNRRGLLGRWQHIEYVVGFNLDRRLFDLGQCMPTVPGAVGAFRRTALLRVGGVSDETLAEDTDLTMALCREGWRVVYEEDAIAWTEAPASLGALWRQRYRWCYGTLQAMWKHRRAVVSAGQAGKLGRRGLLYLLLFQVLLPLVAPVVDIFAVYGLVFLDPLRIVGLWLAFLLLQALLSAYAFRLDGERIGPLWTLPLQQFVYRQLMYLVVIQSVATAVAGSRLRWQRMERYGSLTVPVAPTAPAPAAAGAGPTPYSPPPGRPRPQQDLAETWLNEVHGAPHAADVTYLRSGHTPGLEAGPDHQAPPRYGPDSYGGGAR